MSAAIGSSHIHCLGLNHNTASVALRERLAFTRHRLQTALTRVGCGNDPDWADIQELVILSTCNRVELYAVGSGLVSEKLESFLSETQNIPIVEFSESLYRLVDEEAIIHLMRVASGLDSVVIGEPQILGQVTDAYAAAKQQGTVGKILSHLFRSAIHTGKRARNETTINHNPASIASVAVNLISEAVPNLSTAKIMVLGAGDMAELAVEALRKRGANDILVINRTLEKAQELAQRWAGRAAVLEMLLDHLPEMDIVITSTGAPHVVVWRPMVEDAMRLRPQKPMVLMDIAVPRDVDDEVKKIQGVQLYDIDSLSEILQSGLALRQAQIPKVEAIMAEELAGFRAYLSSLDVLPIIIEMRKQADNIRQIEMQKSIRRMSDLTPEMEKQIEALTNAIVNKILHRPTSRLRGESHGPYSAEYASLTRDLFGLDER